MSRWASGGPWDGAGKGSLGVGETRSRGWQVCDLLDKGQVLGGVLGTNAHGAARVGGEGASGQILQVLEI